MDLQNQPRFGPNTYDSNGRLLVTGQVGPAGPTGSTGPTGGPGPTGSPGPTGGQASVLSPIQHATDTGTANAVAVAPATPWTSYADGQQIIITIAHDNTDATTIAVSGLPPTALQANGVALAAGAVKADCKYLCAGDGTNVQVLNPVAAGGATPVPINSLPAQSGDYSANSHKITGLAAGTAAGDAVRYEQLPAINDLALIESAITNYLLNTLQCGAAECQQFTSGNLIGFLWSAKIDDSSFHECLSYTVPTGKTGQWVLLCGNTRLTGSDDYQAQILLNGGSAWVPQYFECGITRIGTGNTASANPIDHQDAGSVLSFQLKSNNAPVYAWGILQVA